MDCASCRRTGPTLSQQDESGCRPSSLGSSENQSRLLVSSPPSQRQEHRGTSEKDPTQRSSKRARGRQPNGRWLRRPSASSGFERDTFTIQQRSWCDKVRTPTEFGDGAQIASMETLAPIASATRRRSLMSPVAITSPRVAAPTTTAASTVSEVPAWPHAIPEALARCSFKLSIRQPFKSRAS